MTTLTERKYMSDLILMEGDQFYSRDRVTIADSVALTIGAVLGKITASGKYILSDPTAEDGSEDPVAVLIEDADASDGDVAAFVLARHAIVQRAGLVFDAAIDDGTKRATAEAALAARGILVRDSA